MKVVSNLIYAINNYYKDAGCELNFSNNYQLVVAVILSAQCTDKRVNQVTPKVFEKYPTVFHLADANCLELESIIMPCGFFHNKATNLINMAKRVVDSYSGEIPNTKSELLTLSGVGEKTANVVLACAFNIPAIAVDTHVYRVSNRLGLAKAQTVEKAQKQLENIIPKELWINMHYALVLHGRYVCKARNPKCGECAFAENCKYYKNKK